MRMTLSNTVQAAVLVTAVIAVTDRVVLGDVSSSRERARDAVVSIRDGIMDIPCVPRLCDTTESIKHRMIVGDASLYAEVEGKGTPVVLLHGGPGATHHYFHPWMSRAARFSQVIYYDQRGAGLSDYAPGEGYSVDQAAADLENLRKALGIKQWIVIGHSFGGFLAQYYATKHPEALIGMVLVGAVLPAPVTLEATRQYDYISDEERTRIKEIHGQQKLSLALRIFNAHLNGDWKRQRYYKPSLRDLAHVVRYEWIHDPAYRKPMGRSMERIDLSGAFDGFPVPTLIIEGRWDLTWNTDKPLALQRMHPKAELVFFDVSGHNPFEDEPDRFFSVLKAFVASARAPMTAQVGQWRQRLAAWEKGKEASPSYVVRSAGDDHASYERIVRRYQATWQDEIEDSALLMKLGMALYDLKQYSVALGVFHQAQLKAELADDKLSAGIALVWQGQMLDLLGRRQEAIAAYETVANMKLDDSVSHPQFGLTYEPSQYASQRMSEPFTRLENLEGS